MAGVKIGIYKITSPTKKIYVGQSVNIKKRFRDYKSLQCIAQKKLYSSLLKYGFDNHVFEIIEECSRENLNEKEIYYIELYQCFDSKFGLNLRSGGHRGVLSEEAKKRIGELQKGEKNHNWGKKASDTTRKKMSDAKIGEKHWAFGQKTSTEVKEKISKARLGHKVSEETIIKMRLSAKRGEQHPNFGKKLPEETRNKMALSQLGKKKSVGTKIKMGISKSGEKHWAFGKKQSKKHRENIRKGWEKRKARNANGGN